MTTVIENLWTEKQLAKYLALHIRTIRKMRKAGSIPESCYIQIGKRIRYQPEEIKKWLKKS